MEKVHVSCPCYRMTRITLLLGLFRCVYVVLIARCLFRDLPECACEFFIKPRTLFVIKIMPNDQYNVKEKLDDDRKHHCREIRCTFDGILFTCLDFLGLL